MHSRKRTYELTSSEGGDKRPSEKKRMDPGETISEIGGGAGWMDDGRGANPTPSSPLIGYKSLN